MYLVSSEEVILTLANLTIEVVVKVFIHTITDVCVTVIIITLVWVFRDGSIHRKRTIDNSMLILSFKQIKREQQHLTSKKINFTTQNSQATQKCMAAYL